MRSTISYFSAFLLILVSVQYACKQASKQSESVAAMVNTTLDTMKLDNTVKGKDTTFETLRPQFEAWLKEMPLKKPAKCYLSILKNLPEYLFRWEYIEENDVTRPSLAEKKIFQQLINSFIVLPFEDKYILVTHDIFEIYRPYQKDAHGYYGSFSWNISTPSAILATFNSRDSLLFFKDIPCDEDKWAADSLYLKDWDKDGHVELFVKTSTFITKRGRDTNGEYLKVYDITSVNDSIILIFENWFRTSSSDFNNLAGSTESNADWDISFEKPKLMKIMETITSIMGITELKEEDYKTNLNEYQDLIKEQQKWLKKPLIDTVITTYYQQNKTTKQFEEIKK